MLILTSWGIKVGLGRVGGGSSSALSVWSRSGADHRLLRPTGLSASPVLADSCLISLVLESAISGPKTCSPCPGNSPSAGGGSRRSPVNGSLEAFMRRPLLACVPFGLVLVLMVASMLWRWSNSWAVFAFWLSTTEPFRRLRRVSDTHTSPTHSLAHDSSNSSVVRSGQQDDQPWPKTKKGYSTSTSTHTWRTRTTRLVKPVYDTAPVMV